MPENRVGKRIMVIGTSGSGKSVLAVRIADTAGIDYVEMDAIRWLENWRQREKEDFKRVLAAKLAGSWVLDGNYRVDSRDVWERADTVIWLNYGFWTIFSRLFLRTVRRVVSGAVLWSGNRETFGKSFLSRDSIILWMMTTYRRRRRQYGEVFSSGRYPHLTKIELRRPKEADRLVAALATSRA